MWSFVKRLAHVMVWLAAFALGAGALVDYGLARYQREQSEKPPFIATAVVRRGDFQVYTENVGILEAEEYTGVRSETSGEIIGIVPNGTYVKEGDVIIALDVPRMLLAVEDAQRQLQEAQDNFANAEHDREVDVKQGELTLRGAEADLAKAEASAAADRQSKEAQLAFDQESLTRAEAELERKRRQAEAGLIPGEQVRLAELNLKGQRFDLEKEQQNLQLAIAKATSENLSLQAKVRMAKSGLQRAQSRREDELRNGRFNIETQQRQLQRAREDLQKAFIRAPKAGLVAYRNARTSSGEAERPLQEGDYVSRNMEVAQILELSKMRVRLELPQKVGQLVKIGQQAIVQAHGLPDQGFPGKVKQVASFATQSSRGWGPPTGERTFRTDIAVASFKPGTLKPGARATVRIVIQEMKDVVNVPLACVFTRGMGQHERKMVWVRRGKRFEAVRVKLGESNEESAIVESGVKAGTRVALRDLEVRTPEVITPRAAGSQAAPAVGQGGASQ